MKWSEDTIIEESKKYKSITEFYDKNYYVYSKAKELGLLEKMTWLDIRRIIWDDEKVIAVSKKYDSLSSFRKGDYVAYEYARKNNLLDEMTWLDPVRSNVIWRYETVIAESKKYTSRSDFWRGNCRAYDLAMKNGWISEMTWLVSPYHKWNKEEVIAESKKYTSTRQFKEGNITAYNYAIKHGWIKEMPWIHKNKKWDKEKVFEESKKYTSRSEFVSNASHAYYIANKNNWLDEMTWLKPKISILDNIYCVYAYEDNSNMAVYIGLTMDKERRHFEHNKNSSPVYSYFVIKNNIPVPDPIILEDNLASIEAQEKEDFYIKEYKSLGYTVLNKAKTGIGASSLGSIKRWNRKKVFEESKKYSTRSQFQKNASRAYYIAIKNKWLDEMTWLKPKIKKGQD